MGHKLHEKYLWFSRYTTLIGMNNKLNNLYMEKCYIFYQNLRRSISAVEYTLSEAYLPTKHHSLDMRMPMALFRLLSTCAPSPVVSCVESQSAQSLSGCVIALQFCFDFFLFSQFS